ncbi:MAG TPA: glycosyltransferase [Bryobacteraceae bacterium]|nr:glycosyltransferase [Bryobacteraceae bacterium]
MSASFGKSPARILISVIIPALNEERVIGRCLDCIASQTLPSDQIEVLVIDNGSRDKTVEIARSFARQLHLQVFELKNAKIGALRNLGAQQAQGEYLAFLDADCLASPAWLSHALEIFSQYASSVIGAPYGIPVESTWVARAWHGHQKGKLGEVSYIPGGDLLIRRTDFHLVGGFDESLQTNEDYEFCRRAMKSGLTIRAFAELSVCHLGTPQSLSEFYRKQRWHGRHVFRVFLRSLPRLRNLSSVAFAFYVLFCLSGLACGAIIALLFGDLTGLLIFAVAILLAPLLLSLRSTLRRRNLSNVLPLAVLFLAFGIARAVCLLGLGTDRVTQARLPMQVVGGNSRS